MPAVNMKTIATTLIMLLSKYAMLASCVENPPMATVEKAVTQGIEPTHPGKPVAQHAGDGEGEVDIPKRLGGLGDAGRELGVFYRAGCFGAVQLHAADTEHGQARRTANTIIPMPPSHCSCCR